MAFLSHACCPAPCNRIRKLIFSDLKDLDRNVLKHNIVSTARFYFLWAVHMRNKKKIWVILKKKIKNTKLFPGAQNFFARRSGKFIE